MSGLVSEGFENAIEGFGKLVSRDPQNESMGCLVTRENNTLRTTVYGKPAHTDKLLDQTSYNPTSQKSTTLTRGAQIVCNSDDGLRSFQYKIVSIQVDSMQIEVVSRHRQIRFDSTQPSCSKLFSGGEKNCNPGKPMKMLASTHCYENIFNTRFF